MAAAEPSATATSAAEAAAAARTEAQPRGVDHLARLVLRLFFRDVAVEINPDAEASLRAGAAVFVANHNNSLLDPALLMAVLPRPPRFLAKSTLWDNAVVRPFLELAAAIPIYRRQDATPGASADAMAAQNASMFDACYAVLGAGGAIALFPEGRSHSEPALGALKTGAGRIALEAETRVDALRVAVVPIGLTFEDKARFRSRVLVRVGPPIDLAPARVRRDDDPRAAVRLLTDAIADALSSVTLNHTSWDDARRLTRAAEIHARPPGSPEAAAAGADGPLAPGARFALQQAFIDGQRDLQDHPDPTVGAQITRAIDAVDAYDQLLRENGVGDHQVAAAAQITPGVAARFTARSLLRLGLRLPLALVGTALNAPAWFTVDRLAQHPSRPPDVVSTYKLFGGLLLYPALWTLWAAAALLLTRTAGIATPRALAVALAVALLGPLTGYVALRFHEQRAHFGREARAFLQLRRGDCLARLRAARRTVIDAVAPLIDRLPAQAYAQSGPDQRPSSTFSEPSSESGRQ